MTLRKILLEGKTKLGVHVGIISRIVNDQYYVYAVESDYADISTGDIFALENTYCRDVITHNKTMTFDDVAEISERANAFSSSIYWLECSKSMDIYCGVADHRIRCLRS